MSADGRASDEENAVRYPLLYISRLPGHGGDYFSFTRKSLFMDKNTKGAWLIHNTNKLQALTNQNGYQNTFLAGKAGILLSALSSEEQIRIDRKRVQILAAASSINQLELPSLLGILQNRQLIDLGIDQISVLGSTTSATLGHTADIFDSSEPSNCEIASLELAEMTSQFPVSDSLAAEKLSDTYRLGHNDVFQILEDAETIGFVDAEIVGSGEKLLFNGNLFRRNEANKIKAVLDSLSVAEQARITDITNQLTTNACLPLHQVQLVLGDCLFQKVMAIGLYDINIVSNSREDAGFVTLPASFAKYSNSMVDDAFDLAKAFVASITYGMTRSSHQRGRITQVSALIKALIRGEEIGPVDAIREDYKVLELKGVVSVRDGTKGGRSGPLLKLLKKEVGEMALNVIETGDTSATSLRTLPTGPASSYSGPEVNRERTRRRQRRENPLVINDMLSALRRGRAL